MSLDQIFMLLADPRTLKSKQDKKGVKVATGAVAAKADEDGCVWGRTSDGKRFKARLGGKSLARRMAEEAKKSKEEKERKQKRHERWLQRKAKAERKRAMRSQRNGT
jgi:hypothetical protein